MDIKHTPGPWYVNTNTSLSEYVVCAEVFGSGWGSSVAVAMQRDSKARNPISPNEALANARLIAAAPELLEALEQIAEWSDDDRAKRVAEAAIAKATGGA